MTKVPQLLFEWHDTSGRLSRLHPNYNQEAFYDLKAKYLKKEILPRLKSNPSLGLWVWGTGKSIRRKVQPLLNYGLNIERYIEVKTPPYSSQSICYYKDIPAPGEAIILSYVGDRNGKKEIEHYLDQKGHQEGVNYFMLS